MALPNSNISVAMVRDELGASTNDVGQLCIHPNINKWSRWKPMSIPLPTLTDNQRANYSGFKIDFLTKELLYDKPTGGANSPYRLEDFRGYNRDAKGVDDMSLDLNFSSEIGESHGRENQNVVASLQFPNEELFNAICAEHGITHIAIFDMNDNIQQANFGSGRGDAVLPISEIDFTDYNTYDLVLNLNNTTIGQSIIFNFKLCYGTLDNLNKTYLTESKFSIKATVIGLAPNYMTAIMDTDIRFPVDTFNFIEKVNYNHLANTLQFNHMKFMGDMDSRADESYITAFDNQVDYVIEYQIKNSSNEVKKDWTILTEYSYVNIFRDYLDRPSQYLIEIYSNLQITNFQSTDKFIFRIRTTGNTYED